MVYIITTFYGPRFSQSEVKVGGRDSLAAPLHPKMRSKETTQNSVNEVF